jgi:hypothetical protein
MMKLITTMLILMCVGLTGMTQANQTEITDHSKLNKSLPVYTRTLSEVISEKDSGVGKGLKLDDGSVWLIKGYEHGRNRNLKMWTKGDRIALLWNAQSKEGYYIAYNHERLGQPQLVLDLSTLDSFPYITAISEGNTQVILSDNTAWKITWWGSNSSKRWEVGQHILIQGDGYKNNYSLTNLDIVRDHSHHSHAYASFLNLLK